jgi:histidine triad (HIT) family protein
MEDCIFCKIAKKVVPAQIVFEDDYAIAFNDLNAQAPIHVLVIPKKHLDHIDQAAREEPELLGKLLLAVARIADVTGISTTGYRVVTNIGADGGQTVKHLHFHVLGGRHLTWPPG